MLGLLAANVSLCGPLTYHSDRFCDLMVRAVNPDLLKTA